jgi:hypothetical protein
MEGHASAPRAAPVLDLAAPLFAQAAGQLKGMIDAVVVLMTSAVAMGAARLSRSEAGGA